MENEFFFNSSDGHSVKVTNTDRIEGQSLSKDMFFKSRLKRITIFRGKVMMISSSIEDMLNANIEYIIFDEKNSTSEIFEQKFLSSSHTSFFSKWQILKEICRTSPKTKEYYDKRIISQIQKAIEIRNKIAHGYIFYDFLKQTFFIKSYGNNSVLVEEITDDFIDNSIKNLCECINKVGVLIFGKDTTIRTKGFLGK